MLRSRLEMLQHDIERKYEEHVLEYEANLLRLHGRRRRDALLHDTPGYEYYYPAQPTLEPGYWHSYTYNTIVERESKV